MEVDMIRTVDFSTLFGFFIKEKKKKNERGKFYINHRDHSYFIKWTPSTSLICFEYPSSLYVGEL